MRRAIFYFINRKTAVCSLFYQQNRKICTDKQFHTLILIPLSQISQKQAQIFYLTKTKQANKQTNKNMSSACSGQKIFLYHVFLHFNRHTSLKKATCKFGSQNAMHASYWEKVYFRSQILERSSIGEYWNIYGVPVLPENVIFTFFRTCWCYSEAYSTGKQKWSGIVQYLCTSIWDLKYTFSDLRSNVHQF